MNNSNDLYSIDMHPKNSDDLLKRKQKQNKYYTGFFTDDSGNPDFRGLGPILKGVFYMFVFTIMITEKNIYFVAPLLIFFIARVLNAIRFYYVETLDAVGHDIFFIRMNILENYVEGFIALFIALYILVHKIFEKKK
jgi:hypothetical protein